MSIIQHLLKGLKLYSILTVYWATMGVTFVASLVMGFVECHPFDKYWVVIPDPGKQHCSPSCQVPLSSPTNWLRDAGTCAAGSLQLIVFSILEMFTDLMLMVLPVRYLIKIQRPLMAKLRLIALFLVGTAIIAVTLTRLLMNVLKYHRSDASHHIANVELLFAAIVANSPVIYGMFNIKYGSSSQRYASGQSKPRSNTGQGGQQLDTSGSRSHSALPKQQQVWSSRKTGETDSYEELIELEVSRSRVSYWVVLAAAFLLPCMANRSTGTATPALPVQIESNTPAVS